VVENTRLNAGGALGLDSCEPGFWSTVLMLASPC
jgi:hypothetical protein